MLLQTELNVARQGGVSLSENAAQKDIWFMLRKHCSKIQLVYNCTS